MRLPLHASALLTLAALTFAAPVPAAAAFLGGSQGIVDIGVPTTTGLDLGVVTHFDFGTLMTTWNQAGSFAGAPIMLLASTPLDLGDVGAFEFGSADFGTFAATSYADRILSPLTRELDIAGAFAPGTMFGTGAGVGPVAADLTINFTWGAGQIMDVGAILDASATPASTTPEPASLAMLGLGLGLVACFRHHARHRAVG